MIQELLEDIREPPHFFPLLFQFFLENFLALFPDWATSSSRIFRIYFELLFEIAYNYILYSVL